MSESHTPGPWEFRQSDGRYTIYADGESIMGDETYYPWCPSNKADWHLIAAAPDMYLALVMLTDTIPFQFVDSVERELILAAIKKATGA